MGYPWVMKIPFFAGSFFLFCLAVFLVARAVPARPESGPSGTNWPHGPLTPTETIERLGSRVWNLTEENRQLRLQLIEALPPAPQIVRPHYQLVSAGGTMFKLDESTGRAWRYEEMTVNHTNGPVKFAAWVEVVPVEQAQREAFEAMDRVSR